HVAVSCDDPLVGRQVGGPHWAAGVELVGADADLGAQAVLTAIGEAGAGVHHHAGAVHAFHELVGGLGRLGQDRVGVAAAVLVDVVHGFVQRVHHLHRDFERQVLRGPVGFAGGLGGGVEGAGALVTADFYA